MSKIKRRVGRPSRIETIHHQIREALVNIDERSSEILLEMYQVLEDVARNEEESGATRGNAAKWIIARAEQAVKEQDKLDKENEKEDEFDSNQPLISSTFISN